MDVPRTKFLRILVTLPLEDVQASFTAEEQRGGLADSRPAAGPSIIHPVIALAQRSFADHPTVFTSRA